MKPADGLCGKHRLDVFYRRSRFQFRTSAARTARRPAGGGIAVAANFSSDRQNFRKVVLGPMGRPTSKLFGLIFCEVVWGQSGAWQQFFRVECLQSSLGPVGRPGPHFSIFGLQSYLGPVGRLGGELFGRFFAEKVWASGGAWGA